MESITFNLRKVNAAFIIKVEFIQNNQMKILLEFHECRELRPFLTKHIPGSCLRSRINTTCLGLVHGDDPERYYGEGGGRGVHVWEHMYTRGGFMSMYGKTNRVL